MGGYPEKGKVAQMNQTHATNILEQPLDVGRTLGYRGMMARYVLNKSKA
jgi:hypothetical protein